MTSSSSQMQKRGTMRINVVLQSELNHPKIFQYIILHSTFELLDHFYFAWKSFTPKDRKWAKLSSKILHSIFGKLGDS